MGRFSHHMVSFRDRLWIYGGFVGREIVNDVRSSIDGLSWTMQTKTRFPPRVGQAIVEHDGQLFATGGTDGGAFSSEVWSSEDGVHWRQVSSDGFFGPRAFHSMTSHAGRMWIVGGLSERGLRLDDVWSSSNGVVWIQETASAPFSARYLHRVATLGDTMYLVGGFDDSSRVKADVWASTDGVEWTELTGGKARFAARSSFGLVVASDALYLIAGNGKTFLNDVWSSTDGADWALMTSCAAFSPRVALGATYHHGNLYISAGRLPNDHRAASDVWCSPDGVMWYRPGAMRLAG